MRVLITQEVIIHDEAAMLRYANARCQASWQESLDTMVLHNPATLADAVYEALIASNANPSPDLYGIELGVHTTELMGDCPD